MALRTTVLWLPASWGTSTGTFEQIFLKRTFDEECKSVRMMKADRCICKLAIWPYLRVFLIPKAFARKMTQKDYRGYIEVIYLATWCTRHRTFWIDSSICLSLDITLFLRFSLAQSNLILQVFISSQLWRTVSRQLILKPLRSNCSGRFINFFKRPLFRDNSPSQNSEIVQDSPWEALSSASNLKKSKGPRMTLPTFIYTSLLLFTLSVTATPLRHEFSTKQDRLPTTEFFSGIFERSGLYSENVKESRSAVQISGTHQTHKHLHSDRADSETNARKSILHENSYAGIKQAVEEILAVGSTSDLARHPKTSSSSLLSSQPGDPVTNPLSDTVPENGVSPTSGVHPLPSQVHMLHTDIHSSSLEESIQLSETLYHFEESSLRPAKEPFHDLRFRDDSLYSSPEPSLEPEPQSSSQVQTRRSEPEFVPLLESSESTKNTPSKPPQQEESRFSSGFNAKVAPQNRSIEDLALPSPSPQPGNPVPIPIMIR